MKGKLELVPVQNPGNQHHLVNPQSVPAQSPGLWLLLCLLPPYTFPTLLGLLRSRIPDADRTGPIGETDHVGYLFYLCIPTQQTILKLSDLKQEKFIFSYNSVGGLGVSSAGFSGLTQVAVFSGGLSGAGVYEMASFLSLEVGVDCFLV